MPKTVGKRSFSASYSGPRKKHAREILWLLGNLRNAWENIVFSVQSWQRVTATQGGSQRTVRNHARIPLKTLEFLMFSNGPQRKNSVSPEMLVAPRAESYG